MSTRRMTLVLGTAAGAFLAAGLIPLATSPVANADDGGITLAGLADPASFDPALFIPAAVPAPDGFIFATDPLFKLFGITDIGAANPGQDFEAMILEIPKLGITDVLTSGDEATNDLAQFGVPDAIGLGAAHITVNTFTDTMDPLLNSTFTIPFEDPLAGLWDVLVANDFFGL
jgi:hypothetical protein